MTAKHTPGPWEVDGPTICGNVTASNGRKIAVAHVFESVAIDFEAREANGRLIAAAPELLEALKGAVHAIESNVAAKSRVGVAALSNARAAIAKTEGREI